MSNMELNYESLRSSRIWSSDIEPVRNPHPIPPPPRLQKITKKLAAEKDDVAAQLSSTAQAGHSTTNR